jgi:hypothetical protein
VGATQVAINARAVRFQARSARWRRRTVRLVRFRLGQPSPLFVLCAATDPVISTTSPTPDRNVLEAKILTLPDRRSTGVPRNRSSDPQGRRPSDQTQLVVVSRMMEVVAISTYPRQSRSDAG